MTAPQRAQFSNSPTVVAEIFTEDKIDALNAKLMERGISADQVIAIFAGGSADHGRSDGTPVPGALSTGVIDPRRKRL